MRICIVADADNPNKNEVRKMKWSGHLCLGDDKMIQINENTSQPETQENKKCVLSARTISSKDHEGYSSSGLPINRSRKFSMTVCHVIYAPAKTTHTIGDTQSVSLLITEMWL